MNSKTLLAHAQKQYKPSETFALFSGGHDSLCATHLSMSAGLADAVVHINTGIGVQATRDFVHKVCEQFDWPLIELFAKEDCGNDYEAMVMKQGFPGPSLHSLMYRNLKERCLEHLERQHRKYTSKPRRRIPLAFISGGRKEESTRRMGTVKPIQFQRSRVWVAVCHDWTPQTQEDYMKKHDLPKNPVKLKMCMSGECLCGAFAHKGELNEWTYFYPDDPGIKKLMRIREAVLQKFPWDWDDDGPPKQWVKEQNGQCTLFDHGPDVDQMLCTRCQKDEEVYQDHK